ncbi:hypothetical protein [Pseudomonas sp.]|jgi:hypothetical protein|uniref:hypothetical protein n=1 Tax=Pseudomonas sp. TaxID=306 RepID=UPI0019EE9754|nr:hypothetical protein [Pseudomonas sp.]MBF0675111.1 hypothetical protein [Pseudomonas sp.]MBF0677007.1 hypothetical protein [Pseudomonas sp.]
MQEFSSRLRELLELAERTPDFHEVEITFFIRLQEGGESYYLRLMSDSDSARTSRQACLTSDGEQGQWF